MQAGTFYGTIRGRDASAIGGMSAADTTRHRAIGSPERFSAVASPRRCLPTMLAAPIMFCGLAFGNDARATDHLQTTSATITTGKTAPHHARPASGYGRSDAAVDKPLDKPVAMRASFIAETRLGLLAQDPWSPEAQTGALHAEMLFARPFNSTDPLMRYFTPQPHIGASFNLGARTSFVFAGLSWNIDLSPSVFVEASLGGALHDGHRGGIVRDDQAALGCAPLFRESASLGYRFSERLSFMATVEHYGNAGLCSQNRGLTNIGARFGYSF